MTGNEFKKSHTDLDKKIKDYGYGLVAVRSEYQREYFTYSVGLSASHRPEIIVTGLAGNPVGKFISSALGHLDGLGDIELPFTLKNGEPMRARLRKIDNLINVRDNLICQATHRGGDTINCIQLIWPDENNILPDEEGYNHLMFPQPIL